jgi:hypothetical protein
MAANIDLLDAELQVAQTECDDIDQAIAQIGAADPEAKADFLELTERRQLAVEKVVADLCGSYGGEIRQRMIFRTPRAPLTAESAPTQVRLQHKASESVRF